jgi:hypothetical protein
MNFRVNGPFSPGSAVSVEYTLPARHGSTTAMLKKPALVG